MQDGNAELTWSGDVEGDGEGVLANRLLLCSFSGFPLFLAFWIPSSSLLLWRLPDKLWFWDEDDGDEDVKLLVESDALLCFVLFFFFVLSCLSFCFFFRLCVCLSLSVMSVFPSLPYFLPLSPCIFLCSFLPGFFSVCSSLFFLGFSVPSCLSFLVFLFFSPLFVLSVLCFPPAVVALIKPENAMRSCLSNGMQCGGERDATTICCRFRWIVMKVMNSFLWNGAVLVREWPLSLWSLKFWNVLIKPLIQENPFLCF